MYQVSAAIYPNNEFRVTSFRVQVRDPFAKSESVRDSPLDIICKLETPPSEQAKNTVRSGFGAAPKPTLFGLRAKRTLLRAGAALDRCAIAGETVLLTGTLPGSTPSAMEALANWSAYIVHRLKAWIAKRVAAKMDMYVWELQKRGALHLHYVVWIPGNLARTYILQGFKRQWTVLLKEISARSGVDVFERDRGGSWKDKPDVVQARAEIVTKSVAAYLAKYLGKTSNVGKGFEAARGFFPSRWWSVSRPLHAELRRQTTKTEFFFRTLREAQDFMDDIFTVLSSVTNRCYAYEHKMTASKVVVAYTPTFGSKIWSLMDQTTPDCTNISKPSVNRAEWLSTLLIQTRKKFAISHELIYTWCGAFSARNMEKCLKSGCENYQEVVALLNDFEYLLTFLFHPKKPQYGEALRTAAILRECKQRLISQVTQDPSLRDKKLSQWG